MVEKAEQFFLLSNFWNEGLIAPCFVIKTPYVLKENSDGAVGNVRFTACRVLKVPNVERDPRFTRRPRRVKRSGPRSTFASDPFI